MNQKSFLVAAVLICLVTCSLTAAQSLSLAGEWRFTLDRTDAGLGDKWFERALPDKIKLPGSLPAQGIGDAVTTNTVWTGGILDRSFFTASEYEKYRQPENFKVPFWLQPKKYYAGAAWFQRDIEVPADWQGKRVLLSLERPHWETRVWLDNKIIGTNNSLSTPHEYDLGQLAPGKHKLTIRVDNRRIVDVGENSHSISDHTQGNWNGIVGDISLRATPLVWLEDLQVYPHIATKSVTIHGLIGNASGVAGNGKIIFSVGGKTLQQFPSTWTSSGGEFNSEISFVSQTELWDEFHPAVQRLTAKLGDDSRTVKFGIREISTEGTQFTINGRKTFFRGTLDCCIFPKTGHPPTDIESWKREIRIAKSYGLNLIRFHSWCPPEAAFEAADELGFYFQVEIASWANQSTTLGDGKPVDDWLYVEASRILKAYGNHPSFVLMPYGNEAGGDHANAWLARWVTHWKNTDPRRLYTSASGWPQLAENQFHITADPRIQGWGQELKSRINAQPPETTTDYRDYISKRSVPVISHEIGQWCVYPNFAEIPKYTGYLKPRNFEIFRDQLQANGMSNLAKQFLLASGKLQTLCYKEDIESALRTPGMGGFELLDLHDFPGQGTALVGVLDPFWDEKGYVTAKGYRRFCNSTVPLARLSKRVFTTDETLTAQLEVAHFGPQPLAAAVTTWKLLDKRGEIFAQGELAPQNIPIGNGTQLGQISLDLHKTKAPAAYKLVVGLKGTSFENDWDIWIYPAKVISEIPKEVLLTDTFDAAARQRLQAGGKVLLTIPGAQVRNFDRAPVKLGFSSIFWNTAWTGRQAPTTLGILCDPQHPALAEFPTDFCSDWQWWYLIHRAGALRLDLLPPGTQPIVRVIDDWVTARPLGLITEGKVGAGKIIVCGFDLTHGADDLVSQQMRRSLLDYAMSGRFAPASEWSESDVKTLFKDGPYTISAGSSHSDYPAQNAMDGDTNTFWHSDLESGGSLPAHLDLDCQDSVILRGFKYTPRQDMERGRIATYSVEVSMDGLKWLPWVQAGSFPNTTMTQSVIFDKPVKARFLQLTALSDHGGANQAAVAKLEPILGEAQDAGGLGIAPNFNDQK
jgi:hypothetical protein